MMEDGSRTPITKIEVAKGEEGHVRFSPSIQKEASLTSKAGARCAMVVERRAARKTRSSQKDRSDTWGRDQLPAPRKVGL